MTNITLSALERFKAAAEQLARLEERSPPREPMTSLEAHWRKAEARCRAEDAACLTLALLRAS